MTPEERAREIRLPLGDCTCYSPTRDWDDACSRCRADNKCFLSIAAAIRAAVEEERERACRDICGFCESAAEMTDILRAERTSDDGEWTHHVPGAGVLHFCRAAEIRERGAG